MIYILVSGKSGTGKDTCANYLAKKFAQKGYSVARGAFAKGVKDVAFSMGWDGIKDEAGRKLLQDIGNAGREYNKDIWVKQLVNYYSDFKGQYVIVSDWRFPNELTYIQDRGYPVWTLRVEAPEREMLKGSSRYNDISEVSLPSYDNAHMGLYSYRIDNKGSYEDLYTRLDEIIVLMEDLRIAWRLK